MLQNAYFLAKIGADTAENEPAKNLHNFRKMQSPPPLRGQPAQPAYRPGHEARRRRHEHRDVRLHARRLREVRELREGRGG